MRLYSARPDTPTVSLFRSRPLQMGTEEYIYPARYSQVPPGWSEWIDAEGKSVLEMHGISGVVEQRADDADDAVIFKAKQLRHKFLNRQLMNFRLAVDQRIKAGSPAPIPDPSMYDLATEFRALDKWVKEHDPVYALIGTLPTETPSQTVDKVIEEQLHGFGVSVPPTPTNPAMDVPI
jgi:hypothetical protein